MRISLSSAEIPHTWYNLSDELNSVSIWVDGAASLSLAEGNYDIYELVAAITADATFKYSAAYNAITGKVTLTNTNATGYTINFTQADSLGLSKALGFDADVEVGAGGSTTGTNVVNLNTLRSLFIYSSLSIANVITTEQNGFEPILDQIPVKTRPFEILHYTPYDTAPFSATLSDDEIKVFEISLKDQNGNLVQMNSVNFELAFLIELHDHVGKHDRPVKQRRTEEVPAYQKPIPVPALSTTGLTDLPRRRALLPTTYSTTPNVPVATAGSSAASAPSVSNPTTSAPIAPNTSAIPSSTAPIGNGQSTQADLELDEDLNDAVLMAHMLDQD